MFARKRGRVTPAARRGARPQTAQSSSQRHRHAAREYDKRHRRTASRHGPPVLHSLMDHFDQDSSHTHDALLFEWKHSYDREQHNFASLAIAVRTTVPCD